MIAASSLLSITDTLLHLMIVFVVLGMLATPVVVAYLIWRRRGNQSPAGAAPLVAQQSSLVVQTLDKHSLGVFGNIFRALAAGDKTGLAGEIGYLARTMTDGSFETRLEAFVLNKIASLAADPAKREAILKLLTNATGLDLAAAPKVIGAAIKT